MSPISPMLDATQIALVRAHLNELEALGLLSHPSPHQKLFTFLVEEELAGRGHAHNAYSVGVDGLGKPESFDPAEDRSLRVAMHAIRATLKNYYAGRRDCPVQISLPLGGYRVAFAFADPVLDASATQHVPIPISPDADKPRAGLSVKNNGKLLYSIAIMSSLLVAAIGWWLYGEHKTALRCADARPMARVVVNGGADAQQFKALVEEYLAYYPIVALDAGGAPPCKGMPSYIFHFDKLAATSNDGLTDGGYALRVTEKNDNMLIWNRNYDAQKNPYYTTQQLIAAQAAYDLGYGSGIIANKAMLYRWNNDEAEQRFRCLIEAHRYFSSGETALLNEVTQCTQNYWEKSRMADLVGLYAALQWDIAGEAGISKQKERLVLEQVNKALARADMLSPNDKEVVVMKLKLARTETPINVAVAMDMLEVIDKYLTMEPHALNHAAITEAAYLGDFDTGFGLSKRATLITQNSADVYTGELYYYLAHQDWKNTAPYIYGIITWEYPKEQLMALCIAEQNGFTEFAKRARINLKKFDIVTEEEIVAAIDDQFPVQRNRVAMRSCFNIESTITPS